MQDICLFAHFDKDDKVDEYVLHYLKKIKELRFSIIFISTATLPAVEIERLRTDCSDIILRENTGLDFGSWSAGFAKHENEITGRLLLANDSVYGPIGSLAITFDRFTTAPADFYGLVESIERTLHLQSWFLLFEPWVVQSSEFKAILRQPFSTMAKREIIFNGELGLSQRLIRAGFKYNAVYRASRSGLAARFVPFNPTQVLWRELLFYEQIPFLKVELLRDNPINVEDYKTILAAVEIVDPAMCSTIKNHLARSILRTNGRKKPSSIRRSANRLRVGLLRKGYRHWRSDQRAPEIWNFAKLLILMAMARAWQMLQGREQNA